MIEIQVYISIEVLSHRRVVSYLVSPLVSAKVRIVHIVLKYRALSACTQKVLILGTSDMTDEPFCLPEQVLQEV